MALPYSTPILFVIEFKTKVALKITFFSPYLSSSPSSRLNTQNFSQSVQANYMVINCLCSASLDFSINVKQFRRVPVYYNPPTSLHHPTYQVFQQIRHRSESPHLCAIRIKAEQFRENNWKVRYNPPVPLSIPDWGERAWILSFVDSAEKQHNKCTTPQKSPLKFWWICSNISSLKEHWMILSEAPIYQEKSAII